MSDVMRGLQILSELCLQSSVAYLPASSVRAAICNLSFQLCFNLFHLGMSDRQVSHKGGKVGVSMRNLCSSLELLRCGYYVCVEHLCPCLVS